MSLRRRTEEEIIEEFRRFLYVRFSDYHEQYMWAAEQAELQYDLLKVDAYCNQHPRIGDDFQAAVMLKNACGLELLEAVHVELDNKHSRYFREDLLPFSYKLSHQLDRDLALIHLINGNNRPKQIPNCEP